MKLYHYVHCPFCVRVRLALGFLAIPYESIVLPYDDEKTPLGLTGVKMLPIMVDDQGRAMNESLDIIQTLDSQKKLFRTDLDLEALNLLLDRLAGPIHNLCMPYWVWTPEFTPQARSYFLAKKTAKRGPFDELMKRAPEFLEQLRPILIEVENELAPFCQRQKSLSVLDIMLASHLWGLMILPEFRFSQKLYDYLMEVKRLCRFDYHVDFKQPQFFNL